MHGERFPIGSVTLTRSARTGRWQEILDADGDYLGAVSRPHRADGVPADLRADVAEAWHVGREMNADEEAEARGGRPPVAAEPDHWERRRR